MDNIVAVLERNNRPQRDLKFGSGKHFGGDAGAIPRSAAQVVWNGGGSPSRLVLGWISPRLRILYFRHRGIPFPGLPKLFLSATHLVTLLLCDIPHSGYFSPEAMVTALSSFTSLEAQSEVRFLGGIM
jgi:hypothetical protein